MKAQRRLLASSLAAIVLLAPLAVRADENPDSATAFEQTDKTPEVSEKRELFVRFDEEGLLSIHSDERLLMDVVAAVAEQIPLKVYLKQSIREHIGERTVFANFERLPVQDGLKEIFKDQNYLLKYLDKTDKDTDQPAEREIEIWLIGGTGAYGQLTEVDAALAVEPPTVLSKLNMSAEAGGEDLSEAEDEELKELALNASDPRTRINAMLYLGDRVETPDSVDTFVRGLRDGNTEVREMALAQILTVQQDVPSHVFRDVVVSDSDPGMRKQALAILVHKKGAAAIPVLNEVSVSEDSRMSAYAQQLLDYLDQTGATRKGEAAP